MTQQEPSPPMLERPESANQTRLVQGGSFKIRFQTLRVIFALLMREMTTTFGRSSLGYLWVILEPIGAIIVFTVVFSLVFKQPPLGNSFLLFYASGYLPFGIYNACQSKISSAIAQNKALLFYPAVKYVDVILARFTLIALTEITVTLIVFTGLTLYGDTGARFDFPHIFAALAMVLTFGTSIGLMNATLFEIIPSWRNLWRIASRPMFFLSSIFFVMEALPNYIQNILWWNPVVHIVGTMRRGLYPEYKGEYISVLYVVSVTLVITAIGLLNLRTSNKFIINN